MNIYEFLEEAIIKKELYKTINDINFTLNDYKDLATIDGKMFQKKYYFDGKPTPINAIRIHFDIYTNDNYDVRYIDENGTLGEDGVRCYWATSIIYRVHMCVYMSSKTEDGTMVLLQFKDLNDVCDRNMKNEMFKYSVPLYSAYNKEPITPSEEQQKIAKKNVNDLIENECVKFYYKYLKDNIYEADHSEINKQIKECVRDIQKIQKEIDRYNKILVHL